MKLCFGLLIVFACPDETAQPVSDFCEIARPEILRLRSLTAAELAALTRPRKEAIRNLRQIYKRKCEGKG